MIFAGKIKEAEAIIDSEKISGTNTESYHPLSNLYLDFGHKRYENYVRKLSLQDALNINLSMNYRIAETTGLSELTGSLFRFSSTRVMATCAVQAQAAGVAAYLAVRDSLCARANIGNIRELQQELL